MLSAALLAWYDTQRRSLPWRTTKDPYRIWVAEIMLQQTQVKTVIPYYEQFLDRFPDVEALAAATLEEVLALWSGLGYYRRARQMHAAARQVVELGTFPASSSELQNLPGIGPYTAAAVGSRPGDSNQALMELGATICRPKRPDCRSCPLAGGCQARVAGDPERFPPPRRHHQVERIDLVVAVARQKDRFLLFRRPEDSGLLAGLWELPNIPRRGSRSAIERSLGRFYGGRWKLEPAGGRVRHGITHHALVLYVHPARFSAGDAVGEGPEAAWVAVDEMGDYPLSSAVEKVLGAVKTSVHRVIRRSRRRR